MHRLLAHRHARACRPAPVDAEGRPPVGQPRQREHLAARPPAGARPAAASGAYSRWCSSGAPSAASVRSGYEQSSAPGRRGTAWAVAGCRRRTRNDGAHAREQCARHAAMPASHQQLAQRLHGCAVRHLQETRPCRTATLTHQQQELFVLVAARLAAGALCRARLRRGDDRRPTTPTRAPSCCCCRRPSWCPACATTASKVWDTLAIGEYLNEVSPRPGCCRPTARRARTAARSAARCTPASPRCARRCR